MSDATARMIDPAAPQMFEAWCIKAAFYAGWVAAEDYCRRTRTQDESCEVAYAKFSRAEVRDSEAKEDARTERLEVPP